MLHKFLLFQFLLMSLCVNGQVTAIDDRAEKIVLQNIYGIYIDDTHRLIINQIQKENSTQLELTQKQFECIKSVG